MPDGIVLGSHVIDENSGKKSVITKPLSNFGAVIVSDTFVDDGTEQIRYFEIESILNDETRRFQVRANEFCRLDWVPKEVGAQAIIELNKASWIVIESRIKTGIDQSLADEATVIYKVNLTEYQRLRVEIVSHLREIGDAFKIELNSNDFIIQLVAQHSQSHEIYIGQ